MKRTTVDILGVPVDSLTMEGAIARFGAFLKEDRCHSIYTPNAEIIMAAQRDLALKEILTDADMLTADGAGVVLASKLLRRPVPEKVSGIDLVREIFNIYGPNGLRCFFLGSKPGIAEEAARRVSADYPGIVIAGVRDGYFKTEQEEDIVRLVNESGAELLLVALGAPKQERWISRNKAALKVKICMGVGGTLDVLSGTVQLAPDFFRRNGLEWLHRLYKEPRRAIRMMDLPRFMLRVFRLKFLGR